MRRVAAGVDLQMTKQPPSGGVLGPARQPQRKHHAEHRGPKAGMLANTSPSGVSKPGPPTPKPAPSRPIRRTQLSILRSKLLVRRRPGHPPASPVTHRGSTRRAVRHLNGYAAGLIRETQSESPRCYPYSFCAFPVPVFDLMFSASSDAAPPVVVCAGVAGLVIGPYRRRRLLLPLVITTLPEGHDMPPTQRMTDDSLRVRQLSHYQFTWTAGKAAENGTWTLQLVLDEGAWEEVLTVTAEDADNLQDMLTNTKSVFYDIDRRVLMFGVTKTGD